jgi:hypothetical protein
MKKNNSQPWLVLSHAFNMDGRASSQTITDKLPHLRALGIEPVVVSSVLGSQDRVFEHHAVWPLGGAGLRFDLRHVLRRYVQTRWLYQLLVLLATLLLSPLILVEKLLFGLDSQASWSLSAFVVGAWLVWRRKMTVVYSTGGAYSAHVAAYWLKCCFGRTLGLVWIAEIHDPMVSPAGGVHTESTRRTRFLARLEGWICAKADVAWWFTQGALTSAQRRHPAAAAQMLCLLPGAEPPLIPEAAVREHQYGETCVLGHFGTLTDTRSLVHFLKAFDAWRAVHTHSAAQCEIHIYGSQLDAPSKAFVAAQKLGSFLKVWGRLEHSESLGLSGRQQVSIKMRQADVLLLTHGDTAECAEYIPSKFYEYLWAGRPQLAMVQMNPQLEALARGQGFYVAAATDVPSITAQLEVIYQAWQRRALGSGQASEQPIQPIGVRACCEQIVQLVQAIIQTVNTPTLKAHP